jgi:hypothetical protein
MKHDLPAAAPATRPDLKGPAGAIVLFAAVAALYFARDILIPFAFALTLTFILTPVVALLQRLRIGRVIAVLTTVLVSIAAAAGVAWIIANQLMDVANQLPLYRQNIHAKIEAFHIPATGQLGQASASVKEIVQEVTGPDATGTPLSPGALPSSENPKRSKARPAPTSPVPVRMVESPRTGWGELRDLGRPISGRWDTPE